MGCDGGTIPKRDELVKTKKKEVQVSTKQLCNILKVPNKNCNLFVYLF